MERRARVRPDGIQEIDVTIDHGYLPDTIIAENRVPLRIRFRTTEDTVCASSVTFPEFNITKKIEIGKPTTVELMPTEAGEYDFTCDLMGAEGYRGKLIVRDLLP